MSIEIDALLEVLGVYISHVHFLFNLLSYNLIIRSVIPKMYNLT